MLLLSTGYAIFRTFIISSKEFLTNISSRLQFDIRLRAYIAEYLIGYAQVGLSIKIMP